MRACPNTGMATIHRNIAWTAADTFSAWLRNCQIRKYTAEMIPRVDFQALNPISRDQRSEADSINCVIRLTDMFKGPPTARTTESSRSIFAISSSYPRMGRKTRNRKLIDDGLVEFQQELRDMAPELKDARFDPDEPSPGPGHRSFSIRLIGDLQSPGRQVTNVYLWTTRTWLDTNSYAVATRRLKDIAGARCRILMLKSLPSNIKGDELSVDVQLKPLEVIWSANPQVAVGPSSTAVAALNWGALAMMLDVRSGFNWISVEFTAKTVDLKGEEVESPVACQSVEPETEERTDVEEGEGHGSGDEQEVKSVRGSA